MERPPGRAPAPEAGPAEADGDDGAPADGPADTAAGEGTDRGFRTTIPLPFDTAPALRTYRLLLVNGNGIQALVYGSAGAERVLLDTLPRRDSARVEIRVRASWLLLEATDRWGQPLGEEERVDLLPAGVTRWEVPAASARAPGGLPAPPGAGVTR